MYLSISPSTYLSTYLPIYLSLYLSVCLSVYLSIYLSICKLESETILRDVLRFWTWQHQKRSNSMRLPECLNLAAATSKTKQFCEIWQRQKRSNSSRLPQFLNLTTSKTKQFCETSSFFELDNIQNEAILRDFFNFWTWQHQKQSKSARLVSKITSWVQRWRPRTNAFCNFSTPPV